MSTTLADLQRWMDAARESEPLEFKEAKNQYDTTKLMKYAGFPAESHASWQGT